MRNIFTVVFVLPLVVVLGGCASQQPPVRIQNAILSVNKYMPEYVLEANRSLINNNHPNKKRLVIIGVLLMEVLDALEDWAIGQEIQIGDQVR